MVQEMSKKGDSFPEKFTFQGIMYFNWVTLQAIGIDTLSSRGFVTVWHQNLAVALLGKF
jgi:hypothetical protein